MIKCDFKYPEHDFSHKSTVIVAYGFPACRDYSISVIVILRTV